MAEAGGPRGTDAVPRPAASVPFHDDEETASAMMHVLVHVQDAHDVGAARGLPVVLHLLPGLGAVIQELGAGGQRKRQAHRSHPGSAATRTLQRRTCKLREVCDLPKGRMRI